MKPTLTYTSNVRTPSSAYKPTTNYPSKSYTSAPKKKDAILQQWHMDHMITLK